jgi:hypothetical protein
MIMQRGIDEPAVSGLAERDRLEQEWTRVRAHYLPVESPGSIWCFDAALRDDLPRQGWKLHVSATVLTAADTVRRVAPVLAAYGAHYKAPRTLTDLAELNAGLQAGAYSQVGKFITVYPTRDVVALACALDRVTADLAGPVVPYEPRLRPDSRVSYRYGVIHTDADDDPRLLRLPDGGTCPDVRELDAATPTWAANPFPVNSREPNQPGLGGTHPVYAYEAIQQRGKGGTYRAVDLGDAPARRCILKEGRRHGEVDWCGVDGYDRIRNEAEALRRLQAAGVRVPAVLDRIELAGHTYLVLSELAGTDLQTRILRGRTPSMVRRHRLCRDICALVAAIHGTGLAWRDCKPANLIVDFRYRVAAIDFEGACADQDRRAAGFGTRLYLPWNWMSMGLGWQAKDLFALGITLAQVLLWSFGESGPDGAPGGGPGEQAETDPAGEPRRRVGAAAATESSPADVVRLYRDALERVDDIDPAVRAAVAGLLSAESERPSAADVQSVFATAATADTAQTVRTGRRWAPSA